MGSSLGPLLDASAGVRLLTHPLVFLLAHRTGCLLCRYYLDMHVIEMGTPPLVKTAARLFRELCYSNKSQLMAGIICAGWDSARGGQVRVIIHILAVCGCCMRMAAGRFGSRS